MYQVKELLKYKNLVHGISSMEDGNMTFKEDSVGVVKKNKKKFLNKLNIDPLKKQVIDLCPSFKKPDRVVVVKNKKDFNFETLNPEANPVFADAIMTKLKNIFFVINFADCFEIIFYEPRKKVLALVHAGYLPVSHNIISKTLKKIKSEFKVDVNNLVVAVTPGIQECCLKVKKIEKPELKTQKAKKYIYRKDDFYHLDLMKWILDDLRKNKIQQVNMSNFCSACDKNNKFFSHQKQVQNLQKFGRNMLVVGMK